MLSSEWCPGTLNKQVNGFGFIRSATELELRFYTKGMSQPSGKKIYIPPFSGVRLIECREHFQLVPVPAVRTTYGYGKIKACDAKVDADEFNPVQFWTDLKPADEIWCVMQWFVYEDGHQDPGNISSCARIAPRKKSKKAWNE